MPKRKRHSDLESSSSRPRSKKSKQEKIEKFTLKHDKDLGTTEMKKTSKFVFFYGKTKTFSQFHPARFTVDGQEYNCMEQYMHHQKAVIFKDFIRAKKILSTDDPILQKKLGRQVENFDKDVWGHKSVEVVKKGSEQKYLQNEKMKGILFETYPKLLVEASPRDRLWGIGLGASNPKAQNPAEWRGKNLLGKCLTEVRDKLMKLEGLVSEDGVTKQEGVSSRDSHVKPQGIPSEGKVTKQKGHSSRDSPVKPKEVSSDRKVTK